MMAHCAREFGCRYFRMVTVLFIVDDPNRGGTDGESETTDWSECRPGRGVPEQQRPGCRVLRQGGASAACDPARLSAQEAPCFSVREMQVDAAQELPCEDGPGIQEGRCQGPGPRARLGQRDPAACDNHVSSCVMRAVRAGRRADA